MGKNENDLKLNINILPLESLKQLQTNKDYFNLEKNKKMIFKEIDNKINAAIDVFEEELKSIFFPIENATYFTLNEDLIHIDLPICSSLPGVYFFEMKLPGSDSFGMKTETRVKKIIEYWKHKSVSSFWSPSIRQSRLNAHKIVGTNKYSFNNDWIPFYIGKSRVLSKRILEHIFQPSHKTSFSMKLKARKNLYGLEFRVSYITIDVTHYDMIVPHVEKYMRSKLNPIAGKQ